jgi:hypothetical protein
MTAYAKLREGPLRKRVQWYQQPAGTALQALI